MNFFELHIGDYAEATSHLNWLEDAAYSRLLRKYYATERPLPVDLKETQRLVGAKSKAERVAVEKILNEFFELREDGWHNPRADEEIERYRQGEPEREVRRENQNLRQQKHRAERAQLFKDLHSAGQVPHWNVSIGELRSLHAQFCAVTTRTVTRDSVTPVTVSSNAPETAPVTPATATHSHFPLPTSQSPLPTSQFQEHTQKGVEAGDESRPPTTPAPTPSHGSDPSHIPTRAAAVCVAMRAEGLIAANPSHAGLLELLAAGAEVGEFAQAAKEAIAKGKGFAYALAIVRGRRADAERIASHSGNGLDPEGSAAFEELVESDGSRPERTQALQAAIDAAGGWMRIRTMSRAEAGNVKRDFCRAYTEARRRA